MDSKRPGPRSGRPSLRTLRLRVLRAHDVLETAIAELQEQLRRFNRVLKRSRRHLEQGGKASDFARLTRLAGLRAAVTRASAGLDRARHEARIAVFRLALAEGQTLSEIARDWGLSRQLVSRLLKEDGPYDRDPAGDVRTR